MPMPSDIYYYQVEALGFERMDYTDAVVFRLTGQHPFHMSKKLPGRLQIYWISEDKHCELLRLDKKQNILSKVIIKDIDILCTILHFFGFEEDIANLKKTETRP